MSQPVDESARIRGYLQGQANKLSVADLVAKVRTDTVPLRAAGEAVPAARFNDRPADGEWSAAEVWNHILQMNELGASAILGILDHGTLPERIRDVISGETRKDLASSAAYYGTYLARREELLARAVQATGDEHLDIMINHTMFGDFSWREWLLFMRVHDLDHMRQLQAITQAFA